MIRSMTGYGASQVEMAGGGVLRAEIRSVNHRHLNLSVSLPPEWTELRPLVTARVRAELARGSVTVSVGLEGEEGEAQGGLPALDLDRAALYVTALREAANRLGLAGEPDLALVARLPGVLGVRERVRELLPPDPEALERCLTDALGAVTEMRTIEGHRLEALLRDRIAVVLSEVDAVEALAPQRLERERDRLRERVRTLSERVEVDEDRLAREIAYLAERWDISEKIARLRSHAVLFLDTLGGDAEGEVRKVGKRLGFVVQEMNREATTVGAKSNDAAISASSVAIRDALEQVREQLENVE